MKTAFKNMLMVAAFLALPVAGQAQEGHPPGGFPQGPPPGGPGQRMQMQMPAFADLDKNKDKKLTRDEVPFAQMIDGMDENKDGYVDEAEFERARQRMSNRGPGGPQMGERLGRFLDANGDKKVSREEFAKLVQVFDALDADRSGDLSPEEMNRFVQALGETQARDTGGVDVDNLFANNDKNKDGKLTADEFPNQQLFKRLDVDKDGSVTRAEAAQVLKELADKKASQSKPTTP